MRKGRLPLHCYLTEIFKRGREGSQHIQSWSKRELKFVLGVLGSATISESWSERIGEEDIKHIPGCVCFGQLKYCWIRCWKSFDLATQITSTPLTSHSGAPLKREQPNFTTSPNSIHSVGK